MVLTGESEVLGEKLFQCHCIHHKSQSGIEPGPEQKIRISFELYFKV